MKIYVGTGAIAYKEWKGRFYPKDLPPEDALAYYGRTFSTLELNSSFYRMPKTSTSNRWPTRHRRIFRSP